MAARSADASRPFRGRQWVMTIGVVIAALCCIALGVWQLDRRAQRRAANAVILARLEQPPLRIDGAPLGPAGADLRRGVVRGIYDFDHEVVLRNQTHNELPGVDLLTPLRIEGSDAAILVNRGWIPFEASKPEQRKDFQAETGVVEVEGILRGGQTRPSRFAPADPTPAPEQSGVDAWLRVDIARIQDQVPYRLLPVFLEQEASRPAVDQPRFPRPEPEISLSEGSHLYYAGQWFAFSALLLGGYVMHLRRQAH